MYMDDFDPVRLPERNPVTHALHRREVLWQITVPLVIGGIVILALAVLAAFGSSGNVSRWADISLIWVLSPMLVISLIFFVILAGLAYLMIVVIRKLPPLMRRFQDLVATLGAQVRKITDLIVEPILRIHSFTTSVQAGRREAKRQLRRSWRS
jgi:hypothetical protein